MTVSDLMKRTESNVFLAQDDLRRERQRAGKPVLQFSVGTPDFLPDEFVMRALSEAATLPENYKYSLCDLEALTDAVRRWYERRYLVSLERDEILSVHGTQEGMSNVFFPLINPGDLVLLPDPGYPIFSFGARLAGAKEVTYPLREENRFLIDFDALDPEICRKAKAIVVSYPSNPVAATADRAFYERLVDFAKRYDILVIHDNAYSELVYDGEPGMSFLSVPGAKEVGIEFNSLSKSYNLTGCRISFIVGNAEVVRTLRAFRSQIDYGMFYPVQRAAVAALDGPQDIIERNRKGYAERSRALYEGLTSLGWKFRKPTATMFVWVRIPTGEPSDAFCMRLLSETGVMCVPGSSFGPGGEGYVRFALTQPVSVIREAVETIRQAGSFCGRCGR